MEARRLRSYRKGLLRILLTVACIVMGIWILTAVVSEKVEKKDQRRNRRDIMNYQETEEVSLDLFPIGFSLTN